MAFLAPAVRWPDALTSHVPQSLRESAVPSQIFVIVPATFLAVVLAYAVTKASQHSTSAHLVSNETSDANVLKRSVGRSPTVLLVGMPDSGKTSLFSRLVYQTTPSTLPSQKLSAGLVNAEVLTQHQKNIKSVKLVDLPGHPRLRPMLDEQIHQADAIVICVDALMASKANLGGSARPGATETVTDAADLIHSALTTLAKSRAKASNNTAPPSILILFTRADLSPLLSGGAGAPSTNATKDEKRRAQLLTRCRTTLETELGQRRSNMGLNGQVGRTRGSVKIAGLSKVADADPGTSLSQSSGGFFGWIKHALGMATRGTGSSSAAYQDDDAEEEEHDQVTDYIDWHAAQRASDSEGAGIASFSFSKLDEEVVYGGKVDFALTTLGKDRGWALDSSTSTETNPTVDDMQELKTWLVELQT